MTRKIRPFQTPAQKEDKQLRNVWHNMRYKCYKTDHSDYKYYGGRGIVVCSTWTSFEQFKEDMGPRPKGFTIERLDNNGPYGPQNCIWASRKTQAQNTRRNRYIEYQGQRKTLIEWSRDLGMSRMTLSSRLFELGWTVEDAFTSHIQIQRGKNDGKTKAA